MTLLSDIAEIRDLLDSAHTRLSLIARREPQWKDVNGSEFRQTELGKAMHQIDEASELLGLEEDE